ncbi:hypothetical protein, partial [Gilvimarinus sp. 1_MG-2023]|uniref:hypothetical protein n=1 Tax=Gilvimarinus sp. 1_MG-2023 TaxID=3062638 RepID=UPI0026E3F8B7
MKILLFFILYGPDSVVFVVQGQGPAFSAALLATVQKKDGSGRSGPNHLKQEHSEAVQDSRPEQRWPLSVVCIVTAIIPLTTITPSLVALHWCTEIPILKSRHLKP